MVIKTLSHVMSAVHQISALSDGKEPTMDIVKNQQITMTQVPSELSAVTTHMVLQFYVMEEIHILMHVPMDTNVLQIRCFVIKQMPMQMTYQGHYVV